MAVSHSTLTISANLQASPADRAARTPAHRFGPAFAVTGLAVLFAGWVVTVFVDQPRIVDPLLFAGLLMLTVRTARFGRRATQQSSPQRRVR
jgi:hypothetical protein